MPINIDNLGEFDNLEDLKRVLEERMIEHNRNPTSNFDGLSPEQMGALKDYFPANHPSSPLKKNDLGPDDLGQCPLLLQFRFILEKMRDGKEIKLTKTGALPTSMVKEIYAQGYLKNYWIESGYAKVYSETKIEEINITRLLMEISSLVKKRHNKLSLTKKGEKIIDDGNLILNELLQILFYNFNWGYFDGYESDNIGMVIPGFSIYLIKKYGHMKRNASFYAQKYFEAFPILGGSRSDHNCYISRTFSRFFRFLGLVEVPDERFFDKGLMVEKTPLCDALFSLKE